MDENPGRHEQVSNFTLLYTTYLLYSFYLLMFFDISNFWKLFQSLPES